MLGRISADSAAAQHGQPAQRGGEDLDQQHRGPEARDGNPGQRRRHDRGVHPAIRPQPGGDAEQGPHHQPEQQPAGSEREGGRQLVRHHLRHRLPRAERIPEIARDGPAEEADILRPNRPVQAKPDPLGRDRLLAGRVVAQHQRHRIAGHQLQGREHQRPGQHQRRDQPGERAEQPPRPHAVTRRAPGRGSGGARWRSAGPAHCP